MSYIGLLEEDNARRSIAKLMKLLKIRKELIKKVPTNPVEETCLPLQREAVRVEIRETIRYLRKWKVNIKALWNNET